VIDVVVVAGPTAAGKTELGVALAERLGGEVVSADAFAVYRGLDIGTAKPSAAARRRVPHHLIDVADPRERYSAGMFARDAGAAIAAIAARGRLPVVVGGTLFYVRALLEGLFAEPERPPELRELLQRHWRERPLRVRRWLELHDPAAAARIAPADRQRTLRALEVALVAGRAMTELWSAAAPAERRYRALLLGVSVPRDELRARIGERVTQMFAAGLLEEVRGLLASGVPAEAHAMKAIGYRECCDVLAGRSGLEEAMSVTVTATGRLAKRQMTWLRGERRVVWVHGAGEAALAQAVAEAEAHHGSGSGPTEG
jgi:tRNA dimethylallyltransferase